MIIFVFKLFELNIDLVRVDKCKFLLVKIFIFDFLSIVFF